MFVALLFYNLLQYVAAIGAIEQSARKAMRCLRPSEGDCALYESEDLGSGLRSWYGYAEAANIQLILQAQMASYSAWMMAKDFTAEYQVYQVYSNKPEVSIFSAQVPRKRFVGILNMWADFWYQVRAEYRLGEQRFSCLSEVYVPARSTANLAEVPRGTADEIWCELMQPCENVPTEALLESCFLEISKPIRVEPTL